MNKIGALIVFIMSMFLLGACTAAEEEPPLIISQEPTSPTKAAQESSVAVGTAAHRWTETEEAVATETQVPEPTASAVPTTAPTETPEVVASVSDECLACHMDKETLVETAAPEEKAPSESSGVGWGGEVAPLEPWEKVLVDAESFPETAHGEIACTACHGGLQESDKDLAHTDLIARPSEEPGATCGKCHEKQSDLQQVSLHSNQQGYWTVLEARGASHEDPAMQEMFGNHCASCHTTCGDCHVSQPASVGGGLLDGHNFTSDPPMSRTCTACHGSRVGNEFLGKNEGLRPDVHFRQERMTCIDCHTGDELHGDLGDSETGIAHRYDDPAEPKCTDCHLSISDSNMYHEAHGDKLSCQVCHSVSYTSCDSCHVAISEESGNPFFETSDHYLTFLIGRNPRQGEERPYDYVPVRHVPVDPDSFAFYGDNLLPEFDAQPTWRYATPHNIQLETPQTESCNACHGNPDLFLTADKVAPAELGANSPVIVDTVPEQR